MTMRKIIIYKSIEDADKHYKEATELHKGINMLVIQYIEKIHDLNFKDYGLVVSYRFSPEEKTILSKKIISDSRIAKTETRLLHLEGE